MYRVRDENDLDEDTTEYPKSLDHEDAASDHAKYEYSEADGWEWMPNKDIKYFVTGPDNEGKIVTKTIIVNLEFEPSFHAYED